MVILLFALNFWQQNLIRTCLPICLKRKNQWLEHSRFWLKSISTGADYIMITQITSNLAAFSRHFNNNFSIIYAIYMHYIYDMSI